MGHIINPISTRLGFNSFWVCNWSNYSSFNYSYNLMIDTVLRNLILWFFSDSSVSVQLGTIGLFLSHFRIIRRNNSIFVSVFMVLNSSKFLKSQSIETDPFVSSVVSDLNFNQTMFKKRQKFLKSVKFKNFVPKIVHKSKKLSGLKNLQLVRIFLTDFIRYILSFLFLKFFSFNNHFSKLKPDLAVNFLDGVDFVSANFISRFLSRRLSFGFELNRVLPPIVSDLSLLVNSDYSSLRGFRISCKGRFNKTQMASYSWEKFGPVPLNNFSCNVDYAFSKVFMKYGACGIKVWVFSDHRPFKSFRFNFFKSVFFEKFYKLITYKKQLFLSRCFFFLSNFSFIRNYLNKSDDFLKFTINKFYFDALLFLRKNLILKYNHVKLKNAFIC